MPLPAAIAWICPDCRYIHHGSEPPNLCPACGVGSEKFKEYKDPASEEEGMEDKPTVWRCKECGFIHYGSEPPEFCPVCSQPASWFEPIKTGKKKFPPTRMEVNL